MNSVSSLSPIPGGWGRAESSNPPIQAGHQPTTGPWGLSKNHLININSGVIERGLLWMTKVTHFTFIVLGAISGTEDKTKYSNGRCPFGCYIGNYKGVRSCVPETVEEDQMSIFFKSHYPILAFLCGRKMLLKPQASHPHTAISRQEEGSPCGALFFLFFF